CKYIHYDVSNFSKISLNNEVTVFALLKKNTYKKFKSPVYTLIGVKNFKGHNADVFTFSGLDENQITAGYGISNNATPYWSKDLKTIFFGIAKLEKNEDQKNTEKKIDSIAKKDANNKIAAQDSVVGKKDSTLVAKGPRQPIAPRNNEPNKKDLEKPDMII